MMRLVLAKYLLPINERPIKGGCLVLDKDKVIALGNYADLKREYPDAPIDDLSQYIILPGFVNCHTHLELSPLKNKIEWKGSFANWIKEVGKLKRELSEELIIQGVQEAIQDLWESGVVAVGEISSEYLSYQSLAQSSLHGKVYWEYISLRSEDLNSRFSVLKDSMREDIQANSIMGVGISPHSSYTLSHDAWQKVNQYIQEKDYPTAIHVGESIEEQEFFANRRGSLFQFINGISQVPEEVYHTTPLSYLHSKGYLIKDNVIIHMNIMDDRDVQILKNLNLSVIHCPLSHDYFNHPPFKLDTLMDQGVNIALGSDSLASNHTLDFFEELRRMVRNYPDLSMERLIRMATLSGAQALRLKEGFGEINAGQPYGLIGIRHPDPVTNPYETVIYNESPVIHLMSQAFS